MKTAFCAIVALLVCWAFASLCLQPFPDCPLPSSSCGLNGCISKKGGSCYTSWEQDVYDCTCHQGAGCCAYGLVCFDGVCATNNVGAQCDDDEQDCLSFSGEVVGCSDGICKYISYGGDFCGDKDTACGVGLRCINNVCTGQALGKPCGIDILCENGLSCTSYSPTTGTCQEALGEGGDCSQDAFECASGFLCLDNATSATCVKEQALPVGADCSQDEQCMTNYCRNGVCYQPPEAYTPCVTNADCPIRGQKCECSSFSTSSVCSTLQPVEPCVEQEYNANNCAFEYNCTSLSTNYGSCFSNNCPSQLIALQTCGCEANRQIYGSCLYSDYCPGSSAALPDLVGFPRLGHNGASA